MKKPTQGGLGNCNGEFLQKPPEEFSAWDDWKFSLGGILALLFLAAVPLAIIAGGLYLIFG